MGWALRPSFQFGFQVCLQITRNAKLPYSCLSKTKCSDEFMDVHLAPTRRPVEGRVCEFARPVIRIY